MHNPDCIFCQIASHQAPFHEVWSDHNHLAFLSIFPNTEGFTVVIPKEHHDSYAFNNSDQVLTELLLATKKVAKILDGFFPDVARCGMFLEGYGVDHLHSKLFPMHGTANLKEWQPIDSELKDMFFEQYPGFLSSNNAQRADDEALAKLAKQIRASYQS